MAPRDRLDLGRAGEALAAEWYVRRGYRVLARNWRDGRAGELDLVVRRRGQVVFCEVKTRSGTAFGTPAEAVDWRKQRRLRRLAVAWLAASGVRARALRFDVACVTWPRDGSPSLEVIEAAF